MPSACSILVIASLGASLSEICGSVTSRPTRSDATVWIDTSARFTIGRRFRSTFPSTMLMLSVSPRRIARTCVWTNRFASTQNVLKASLATTFSTWSCTSPLTAVVSGPASTVARSPSDTRASEIVPCTSSAEKTWSVSFVAIDACTAGSSASGAADPHPDPGHPVDPRLHRHRSRGMGCADGVEHGPVRGDRRAARGRSGGAGVDRDEADRPGLLGAGRAGDDLRRSRIARRARHGAGGPAHYGREGVRAGPGREGGGERCLQDVLGGGEPIRPYAGPGDPAGGHREHQHRRRKGAPESPADGEPRAGVDPDGGIRPG